MWNSNKTNAAKRKFWIIIILLLIIILFEATPEVLKQYPLLRSIAETEHFKIVGNKYVYFIMNITHKNHKKAITEQDQIPYTITNI